MATVEPAQQQHAKDIQRISKRVFGRLGDYGRLLPKFFSTKGVTTYVARVGPEVVGFMMLGFLPWNGSAEQQNGWIGDLLALAVEPERQRQGIGSSLMHRAFELVEQMSEWRHLREIQLVCPESETGALQFFSRHGFSIIRQETSTFSSGHKAVRLAKTIV